MKLVNNICVAALLAVSLSSCLKRDSVFNAEDSPAVVEFSNTGTPTIDTFPLFKSDVGALKEGDSATFNINIGYISATGAPNDIAVALSVNEADLTAFNNSAGTSYVLPPSDVCTLPAQAIVRKGSNEVQIKVAVKRTANFNYDASYAIPVKITSAGGAGISSTSGQAVYAFSARNSYDGAFTVTGTFYDSTLGAAATANYPKHINLITDGARGAGYYDADAGSYRYTFFNNGGGSYYGNFAPIFHFDDSGNVTSVTNYYGQGTNANVRSAQLNPTGVNKMTFDSGGKPSKLEVSYYMVQSGKIRLTIQETFTYTGER
jgi:hypothetical protein